MVTQFISPKYLTAFSFLIFQFLNEIGYTQVCEKRRDLIFTNQIKFSITPQLYENLYLTYTGVELLKSRPCFSAEATISYYQYITKGFGINIGAGLGLAPFNVNYNFASPPGTVFKPGIYFNDNFFAYLDYLWIFPLSFQKMFSTKNNNILYNLEAGVKWNRIMNFPYSIAFGTEYVINDTLDAELFNLSIEDDGKQNLFSYFLKFGIIKPTSKKNALGCNLVLHYCPQLIGHGWYKFYNLNYDSYGNVEQNINYIGIEINYGLTLMKSKNIQKQKK